MQRLSNGRHVGSFDGRRLKAVVDGRRYMVHRLAWLYHYGGWPVHVIDHINGDASDNRIANLRDVPQRINNQNRTKPSRRSKTGLLGVSKTRNGYRVCMSFMSKPVFAHNFETAEEASAFYLELKRRLHDAT